MLTGNSSRTRVAVIGAGASGLVAALMAARRGAAVTLFERNAAPGRKLLVTGSGRCNITNAAVSAEKYACADPAWLEILFNHFGVPDLLDLLGEIGILVYHTSDGWYYPLSNSAHTVVQAFTSALDLAGVNLRSAARVTAVEKRPGGFAVRSLPDGGEEREDMFQKVILSAGGKAYPTLGSRGELFAVLERLGHTVLPKRPALAPVLADLGELQPLQGSRLDAGVTLWEGKTCLASSAGNLIFTEWGLNGPAVMDISHQVSARPEAKLSLSLNLLAFFQAEFDDLLTRQRKSPMPLQVFLGAFFPPKVAAQYLKTAHLGPDLPLNRVEEPTLERLVQKLSATRLAVKGVRGFEYCQVSAGGVPVGEVDPLTLESRRVSGLYLTGESLDVVGPCGGYNLQYAFSSGAAAGMAAAEA